MSTEQPLPEPRYEVRIMGKDVFIRYIYRDNLDRRCTQYIYAEMLTPHRDTKSDALLFAKALAARDGAAFVDLLNNT